MQTKWMTGLNANQWHLFCYFVFQQTDILQSELVKKENVIKENTETICEYKVQTAKTVQELAEKNELIKNQSETILRQNVNTSHGLDEITKLNEVIAKQKDEIDAKNKDLEIYTHNLEEERLAVKVLKEKNDKIEERLNNLTNTLDKICELGVLRPQGRNAPPPALSYPRMLLPSEPNSFLCTKRDCPTGPLCSTSHCLSDNR